MSLSKRKRLGIARRSTVVAVLLALLSPAGAGAKNYDYGDTEINQKDAGGYASNNYWNGSGDSKDEGVRNAMRAMNCLAALNIGGAIHYGYKGYGNYTNSQRMDDLDAQVWKKKGSLDSIGNPLLSGTSGANGNSGNGASDVTGALGPQAESAHMPKGSNRRGSGGASGDGKGNGQSRKLSDMDKGFLYRGETGEVAAEFEKKSGMNRETLFNYMANVEANGLSWDDPNVADKMEAYYKGFVSQIPNKDYRANIEKMHDMFSFAKKSQVLEEAAAFYKKMRWGDGPGSQAADNGNVQGGSGISGASSGDGSGSGDGGRGLASSDVPAGVLAAREKSDEKPKLTKEQMGMYLGLDDGGKGDELKEFMGSDETIFRVVSKRYRKLTPMMIGRML